MIGCRATSLALANAPRAPLLLPVTPHPGHSAPTVLLLLLYVRLAVCPHALAQLVTTCLPEAFDSCPEGLCKRRLRISGVHEQGNTADQISCRPTVNGRQNIAHRAICH
ncbi:hypothetical protein BDZ85DRAFT_263512, partial [Elsinoe ampelina]